MLKSIIVAQTLNHAIGKAQQLLCHLPKDLKHFRQTTMGHHLIMGRKTFESIGKPLPGRTLIIVTHNVQYQAQGCIVAHSMEAALDAAQQAGEAEVFIAGGAEIYRAVLPIADKIYLTEIKAQLVGDVFFPPLDARTWREVKRIPHYADDSHAFDFDFVTLHRSV